jgi:hypothetical protein
MRLVLPSLQPVSSPGFHLCLLVFLVLALAVLLAAVFLVDILSTSFFCMSLAD